MIEGTSLDVYLHILTFLTALGLFSVSIVSYRKKRNSKFIYVTAAFGVFAFKEAIVTLAILGISVTGLTGISHILNLVILGLFFWGAVK